MNSVSRAIPLRWVYPSIGAVVAALAAAILYAAHADPLVIAVVATLLCVGLGWALGHKWDILRETAITDPLTGVANRRHFDQRLQQAIPEAAKTGMPLTLLFVDLDHLKEINDKLGHAGGDLALRMVGESLARTCRSRDIVARWGGDEFAILAMWTTSREGMILGHRIRETLAQLARQSDSDLPCPTVSIGVAELSKVGSNRPDALLHAADDALYAAKTGGRNRVCLAAPQARKIRKRARPTMANLKTRPLRLPTDASQSSEAS